MFPPSKILVVAISLLAMAQVHAGNPPPAFLDVPWSETVARAKEVMLKRADLKITSESREKLGCTGGMFADYPVDRIELEFPDGRFSVGTVFLTIPPGADQNGTLLRNLQFEKLFKSLSEKYGKIERAGDGNHTEGNWTWPVKERLGDGKRTVTVHLSYSWNPYEFIVRYSNQPTVDAAPVHKAQQKKAEKIKDL